MSSLNKILFLVAHSDDEILGCGGTLFKKSANSVIDLLILADGSSSRGESLTISRDSITKKIHSQLIHPGKIFFLNLPDNKMDSMPLLEIISKVHQSCGENLSNIYSEVYTHSSKDLNIDHQIASKITRILFRPSPNAITKGIFEFETPSATDWSFQNFHPNLYENIENSLEFKKMALDLYSEELRSYPHPRSLEAILNLSRYRGSAIGLAYAEAFEIIWQKNG